MTATYVLVGFKVSQSKSLCYAKCSDIPSLVAQLEKALTLKDADFISIRRIKIENEKTNYL